MIDTISLKEKVVGLGMVTYNLYPGLKVIFQPSNVIDITGWYAHPLCLRDCMQSVHRGCVAVSYKEPTCTLLNLRKNNLTYVMDPDYFYYEITLDKSGNGAEIWYIC